MLRRPILFAVRAALVAFPRALAASAAGMLVTLPLLVVAQAGAEVTGVALGGAGIGSFVGSFIGAAVGSFGAVRRKWDAEAKAAMRLYVDDLFRDHQRECPARSPRAP